MEDTKKAQTILITGASSGIGKAAAQVFAANGWNVCATMPEISSDESLKQIPNVLVAHLDVTGRSEHRRGSRRMQRTIRSN